MKKILISVLCLSVGGCLTVQLGTLPFVKLQGSLEQKSLLIQNVSFSNEPQPGTTMYRVCDPYLNLNDAMTEAAEQEGLVGLKNFELYSTTEGLQEGLIRLCVKVRGIPVKAKQ